MITLYIIPKQKAKNITLIVFKEVENLYLHKIKQRWAEDYWKEGLEHNFEREKNIIFLGGVFSQTTFRKDLKVCLLTCFKHLT